MARTLPDECDRLLVELSVLGDALIELVVRRQLSLWVELLGSGAGPEPTRGMGGEIGSGKQACFARAIAALHRRSR